MLVGCQSQVTTPKEPLTKPVKLSPVSPKPSSLVIALVNAQRALERDNLMKPAGNSAFDWYKKVLKMDPDNAEAHWGMQQIGDRYLDLAKQAFVGGNAQRAEIMLERAQRVAASNADVQAIRANYGAKAAEENAVELPIGDLSARNQRVIDQLSSLAVQARDLPSRLLIIARTDAEGRWIYQQMRNAIDGSRLRGDIQLGSVPKIVLLDSVLTD